MSSVAIARQLMIADPTLFSTVPSDRVFVGVVPQGTTLPCIGISEIVSTDRTNVAGYRSPKPQVKVTARVQVTVMAPAYPACSQVMKEVRRACRDYVGDVGNYKAITCRLDGSGPDFQTEEGAVCQTQDLRITFDESNS
jgi:hypothetical protein